eukprot:3979471-Pyramimonas_sp.AAC.1
MSAPARSRGRQNFKREKDEELVSGAGPTAARGWHPVGDPANVNDSAAVGQGRKNTHSTRK